MIGKKNVANKQKDMLEAAEKKIGVVLEILSAVVGGRQ